VVVLVVVITGIVLACEKAGLFQRLPFDVGFLGLPAAANAAFYAYIGNAYSGMGIMGELVRGGILSTTRGC
jgi:hypothetical protein